MMSEFNNGLNQMIVAMANRFERIAKYPDDAGSARIGVMTLQDTRDLLYLAKRRIENLATENLALDADRLAFAKLYGDKTGDPEVVELANTFIPSATNAFLDEIKTQARLEGINFAAGRLAAAFNHSFVDKPVAEVGDVVRMIMGAKEENMARQSASLIYCACSNSSANCFSSGRIRSIKNFSMPFCKPLGTNVCE
ncbi:hypothetical protein H0I69_21185 [Yersinia enterocolitica]|uniref:hypothetical protein n=1 Tax=Yersinia enterocolitica TaxID=630 RepID=UPI001CA592E8|nr:hypothetical protein [Yersinia enterocolitica]MBW5870293.1 hypothetical protein [Yersinia enterocolitica]